MLAKDVFSHAVVPKFEPKFKLVTIRDFQIKKYPKTDAKIFSISPLSVLRQVLQRGEPPQRTGFSASLWFVHLANLFLVSP
jgi:hypothetical protein